jgi:hypothetical protein
MPVQVVLPEEHRLVQSQTCSLNDLFGEPMVLLDQPRTRDYFLSLFGSKGLSPNVAYRTESWATAVNVKPLLPPQRSRGLAVMLESNGLDGNKRGTDFGPRLGSTEPSSDCWTGTSQHRPALNIESSGL